MVGANFMEMFVFVWTFCNGCFSDRSINLKNIITLPTQVFHCFFFLHIHFIMMFVFSIDSCESCPCVISAHIFSYLGPCSSCGADYWL